MTSKKRIADLILNRAAQGDSYAKEIVNLSDKPREIPCWEVTRKEIEPYLLPFLKQENNRYFTARALNRFIVNKICDTKGIKENLYWIRGCNKILISIFGQPISRNRWNTRICRINWRREINAPCYMDYL